MVKSGQIASKKAAKGQKGLTNQGWARLPHLLL
jgi:hypothetical protein